MHHGSVDIGLGHDAVLHPSDRTMHQRRRSNGLEAHYEQTYGHPHLPPPPLCANCAHCHCRVGPVAGPGLVAMGPPPVQVGRSFSQGSRYDDEEDGLSVSSRERLIDQALDDQVEGLELLRPQSRDHLPRMGSAGRKPSHRLGLNKTMTEVCSAFGKRTTVLVLLLLLQSLSGFILQEFRENWLDDKSYTFMTLFLTMLVGAGGNAGNQSAVFVICGLATGEVKKIGVGRLLGREMLIGWLEAMVLCAAALVRVLVFNGSEGIAAAWAIVLALFFIVVASVLLGALLPLVLWKCKVDPAHAGPVIQVVMDIIGVTIACLCIGYVLD